MEYGSVLLYTGVLAACWALARLAEKKNSRVALWGLILLLSLFAGLRHESVGLDTLSYATKYAAITQGRFDLAYALETSFKYICFALSKITPHPAFLLSVLALLTHACILCRFWELRTFAPFSCMAALYYASFFFISLNCMRQFCAIALVFYATRYLYGKKILPYMLFVAAAMLFHRSAALGFVLLGFVALRWKELPRWQKIFFGCAGAALPVGAAAVFVRYGDNFEAVEFDPGLMQPAKLLFLLGTLVYILFLQRRQDGLRPVAAMERADRFALLLTAGGYFIGLCLSFLEYFFQYQGRIAWYFLLFECVYFSFLLKVEKKPVRYLFAAVFLLLTGYSFVYSMLHNSQGTVPYRFFWQ